MGPLAIARNVLWVAAQSMPMGTILRHVLTLLLAMAALMGGNFPAQAQGGQADRIVVIGDLHGDYSAYRDIVSAAGVSDREGHWTGGRTTLIQMGDMTDRGPSSLAIIRDLRALARQAQRRGGQVIVLVGNHEAMNVIGDLRYVSEGEYAAFRDGNSQSRREQVYLANRAVIEAFYSTTEPPLDAAQARAAWLASYPLGMVEHRLAWHPEGEIGSWVRQLPAAVLIDGTLFVHGGLSAEYAVHTLDEINRMVGDALSLAESSPSSILEDPLGPLWYRGNVFREAADAEDLGLAVDDGGAINPSLCEDPRLAPDAPTVEEQVCRIGRLSIEDELDLVLSTYGADRMVIAHTPSLEGIVSAADGRLIRADTGISTYYGGPHSYLELHGAFTIAWKRQHGGEWEWHQLPTAMQEDGQ